MTPFRVECEAIARNLELTAVSSQQFHARCMTRVLSPAARERPDPIDEPVEEHCRVNSDTDQRVGFSAPASRPVGHRHAAGQGPRQLDVHRRRPGGEQLRVQRDRRGQRVVQMRLVTVAEVVIRLQVEPRRVLDHPDQRVGRRRPGAPLVVNAHRGRRRVRSGRQADQYLRRYGDVPGHIQAAQNRKRLRLSTFRLRWGPGGEHFGRRLGIHADVPFRHRVGVAAVVVGTAHDHQPAQQRRQSGFLAQRQREVGQRAGSQPDQLSRMRMRRLDPCRRRIVAGEPTIGRRQLRVSQTPWPMDFPDRKRGGVQRVLDTFGYRHAVDPAQLEQAEVVLAHLIHADVPAGRGDADQLGLRAGQQVNQRNGIVYTGVDVGENWCAPQRARYRQ